MGAVARELGLSGQTLRNWVKAAAAGRLNGPGTKPVTPEQMELSGLRADNGHFGCTGYHPLFCFNQFGDLERALLREGNVHSADTATPAFAEMQSAQNSRGTSARIRANNA